MYELLFKVVIRRVPAETAHRWTIIGLRLIQAVPLLPALLRLLLRPRGPRVRALGLEFPGPVGLAAGFDKDAEVHDALAGFGFGHVEVGTLTASPQPGNPKPRLFRLAADRAVINRMGFNNHGAAAAAARLRRRRGRGYVVGVNIGKTKAVAEADAVTDYVLSARAVAPYADYLVVNVSSPNTPGLRDLQAVDVLRPLLTAVRAAADESAGHRVPLLVKIAPDLADEDVDAVADLALDLGLDGIIATNTTIGRAGLLAGPALAAEAGGLSGAPLRDRSLDVLKRLRSRVGSDLVLISVGGVSTARDVLDRLDAGATLVQAYTAMIYGGPLWAWRVQRDLARLLDARG